MTKLIKVKSYNLIKYILITVIDRMVVIRSIRTVVKSRWESSYQISQKQSQNLITTNALVNSNQYLRLT